MNDPRKDIEPMTEPTYQIDKFTLVSTKFNKKYRVMRAIQSRVSVQRQLTKELTLDLAKRVEK